MEHNGITKALLCQKTDFQNMEDTKENLEPADTSNIKGIESSFEKPSDNLEFSCTICDVVYLSKENYEKHVSSVFHDVNMNRKRNDYYPRSSRSTRTTKPLAERTRSHSRGRAHSTGYHNNRAWQDRPYHQNDSRVNDGSGRNGPPERDRNSSYAPPNRGERNYASHDNHGNWQDNNMPIMPLLHMNAQNLPNKDWYSDAPATDSSAYYSFCDYNLAGPSSQFAQYRPHQEPPDYHRPRRHPPAAEYPVPDYLHPRYCPRDAQPGPPHQAEQHHASPPLHSPTPEPQRRRTDSLSGDHDSEHRDSHTKELSMKASSIIDAVLKGEAPGKDTSSATSQPSKPDKSTEDILQKAEKMCEKFRKDRQYVKDKQEILSSIELHSDKNTNALKSSKPSSSRPTKPKIPNLSSARGDKTRINVTSSRSDPSSVSKGQANANINKKSQEMPPRPSHAASSSQSRTEAITSQSAAQTASSISKISGKNLKDTVVRMLKYPKSRRGVGHIEKFLQKHKDPSSSKHRLLKLMQPLSQPESTDIKFANLAPEVQQHILSLIDEVAFEIGSEEIVLSDDDKADSDSGSLTAARSPLQGKHAVSHQTGPDASNVTVNFNLEHEDPDLSCLLSSGYLQADLVEHLQLEPENTKTQDSSLSTRDSTKASTQIIQESLITETPVQKDPISKGNSIKSERTERSYAENKALAASIMEEAKKDCANKRNILDSIRADLIKNQKQKSGVTLNKTCDGGVVAGHIKTSIPTSVQVPDQAHLFTEFSPESSSSKRLVTFGSPAGRGNPPVSIAARSPTVGTSESLPAVTSCAENLPTVAVAKAPVIGSIFDSPEVVAEVAGATTQPRPVESFLVVNNPDMIIPSSAIIKIEPQDPDSFADLMPATLPMSVENEPPREMSAEGDVHSTNRTDQTFRLNDSEKHASASVLSDHGGKHGGKRARSSSAEDDVNVTEAGTNRAKNAKQPRVMPTETVSAEENTTMDELYTIAMEEEEVHTKMVETDKVILELTQLVESTKARLQCREEYKKELQTREDTLRRRRIELLTEARVKRGTHSSSVEVVRRDAQDEISRSCILHSTSVSTTAESLPDPDPIQSTTLSTVSPVSTSENDGTLKMEPDTTEGLEMPPTEGRSSRPTCDQNDVEEERAQVEDAESQNTIQTLSESLMEPSQLSQVDNKEVADSSNLNDDTNAPNSSNKDNDNANTSNVSVKYLGSFINGDAASDIIQHLASNFKHLKTTYSFLNDGDESVEMLSCSRSESDEGQVSERRTTPKRKVKSKKKTGKSPKVSEEEKLVTPPVEFKVPEVPADHRLASSTSKGKKGKNHKKKQASRSVSESDTDADYQPQKDRKRKKGKQKDKGTSKILKDYLHGSSSTDVEIVGLEAPTPSSLNTSSAVTNDSKKKGTDSEQGDSSSSNKYMKREHHAVVYQKKLKHVTAMALNDQSIFIGGLSGSVGWYKRVMSKGRLNPHSNINQTTGPIKFICTSRDTVNDTEGIYIASADKSIIYVKIRPKVVQGIPWETVHTCPAPVSCGCSAWDKMYLGLTDGSVVVLDTQKGCVETTFVIGDRAIMQMAAGQEGRRKLLCMCEAGDPSIYVRDYRSRLFIRSLEGHIKMPLSVKVKNHLVYSGGEDKMVQIHNLNTGDMESLLKFESVVTDIVIDTYLLVGEKRGIVNVLNAKTLMRDRVLYSHEQNPVSALCLDPAQSLVYVGDETGHMKVMSLANKSVPCEYSTCRGQYSFGYPEHLMHHIWKDHIGKLPKTGTFECLWANCFTTLQRKDASLHLDSHFKNSFR